MINDFEMTCFCDEVRYSYEVVPIITSYDIERHCIESDVNYVSFSKLATLQKQICRNQLILHQP